MNENANTILGEAPVGRLMLRFSIPGILSLLIAALYNMVDQIFIGHGVGYLGNGATNVVYPATVIALALSIMVGNGCAAYLSICQGRNDHESSHKSVGNGIMVTVLSSLALTVLFAAFSEQILWGFGATENNIPYARDYFRYIIPGIPCYMFQNSMNAIIRADGSPRFAMMATVSGCIANMILDPVAIFVLDMGVAGAAIATVIGQLLGAVVTVWYFFHTKTFRLQRSSFRLQGNILGKILPLGACSLLTQVSTVIVLAVMNNILVHYGTMSEYGPDIPLTVYGIIMKIFSLVTSVIIGLALGTQPIVGYNYGAGKFGRMKDTFKKMVYVEVGIGLASLAVFEFLPMQIMGLFGEGDVLYQEFAVTAMRIYLSGIVFYCVQRGCAIFLQSMGKPALSAALSLLRDILLNIPAAFLLPLRAGLMGALYSAPAADVVSFLITIAVMKHTFKKITMNTGKAEKG
ncbi:MAG: MATE family efflux transporter [Lachnospiraceae bacterium]|nr:MATE family efflux transporter [Lachnospiraceae bacterium]